LTRVAIRGINRTAIYSVSSTEVGGMRVASDRVRVGPGLLLRVAVLSAVLGVGAVVLAATAAADLPKPPACSDVSDALLESTLAKLNFAPIRSTAKVHQTKTVRKVVCFWYGPKGSKNPPVAPGGMVLIQYNRYTSAKAALTDYRASQHGVHPVIDLQGIGDAAYRVTGGPPSDGYGVFFVDGIDVVTIKAGFADTYPIPVVNQEMVSLAKQVERVG
jgi:hypothetical protein